MKFVAVSLSFLMLVGCGKKDPDETDEKALSNMAQVESIKVEIR